MSEYAIEYLLAGGLDFLMMNGVRLLTAFATVIVGRLIAHSLRAAIHRRLTDRNVSPAAVSTATSAAYAMLIAVVWSAALVQLTFPVSVLVAIVVFAGLDVLLSVRESRRVTAGLAVAASVAVFAVGNYTRHGRPAPSGEPAFEGSSSELHHTQVVATLDAPIEKGKNAIWCVSFQAAWKALQLDLAKEPVALAGDGPLVDSLNDSYVPGREVPEDALYTAAGWEDEGILEKIREDLRWQFPAKEPPTFPGIIPGSFVAYSYLEARAVFRLPYFQSTKPLEFTAGDGTTTKVSSFGIRPEDDYAYTKLREQPRVLFSNAAELMERTGKWMPPDEIIVDLDRRSDPSQIIVAMVEPRETLAETLADVEEKIAGRDHGGGIGINDVLLVPDVVWRITHHFAELESREFLNPALADQRMDVAQQDISFRLDRFGAELKSESKMYCLPIATHYIFDRPFLIYMRKRGEQRPYFVMWVDNAELLRPL